MLGPQALCDIMLYRYVCHGEMHFSSTVQLCPGESPSMALAKVPAFGNIHKTRPIRGIHL